MDLNDVISELKEFKSDMKTLNNTVQQLCGSNASAKMLIKWVIFPLIVVMGALVGLDVSGVM
jgi:hypothetical protein